VTFCYGSGSADPCHWITDPDLFFSDAIKKFFCLLLPKGTSVFKDNIVIYEVTKLYKSGFFLYFFSLLIEGSGTVILTFENRAERVGICADNGLDNEGPDPDPER
jgi:hypothetical protein